uniref:Uncharacterized protein n=1 Tax=Arundo donax TaxID=35708 RepID=A0A0A9BSZ0_ARUDO
MHMGVNCKVPLFVGIN